LQADANARYAAPHAANYAIPGKSRAAALRYAGRHRRGHGMRLAQLISLLLALLLALAMLAACTATPPPAAADAAGPAYYVMRHLEKAEGPDPGLSAAGQANAGRLAAWLAGRPPAAIYVSTTRRARETAAPAAERFSVPPKEYDPAGDPAELIARVKAETGAVLVIGHSNTVPELVARLAGERPAPLADTDYGDIWVIADGRTEKRSLAQ
jgi:phosphohistidine phosphatase SixA